MKLKPSNIIAFDLGSSKIAALGASIDKNGEARITSQVIRSSKGIRGGLVTDLAEAEKSFVSAIYDLENELDKSVNQIALSISNAEIKSFFVNYKIKLGNNPISKQDLRKLIQKALSEFKMNDMQIIHYFPIEYILDDNNLVDNPIGLHAKSLSCQIHIIAACSSMLLNISKCFANCQIEVREVISSVYAAGESTLNEDEKNLGAIIIDFGSQITSFAVFSSGNCIFVGSVPLGSFHITSDIARKFSLSLSEAEKLKILHGTADPSLLQKEEQIVIDDLADKNNYRGDVSISNLDLAKVINNKVSEIFTKIKQQYEPLELGDIISQRVVVTGGGANLHGLPRALNKILEKQVRSGAPLQIDGFLENYNANIYSSAIGVVLNESNKILKYSNIDLNENNSWIKKTFSWIKENI